MRLKFELTNQDSVGGKNFAVLTSTLVYSRKGIENRQLFSLEMALKRDLQFPKPYQIVIGEKSGRFCVSKLLIWRQKWVAGVRYGNSPGRIIVVLTGTKYALPRQIKPGILKLTIRKGQSNFGIVFIFVCCEEKGCYRIVSAGQLGFDCCSYCGRSRCMQGMIFNYSCWKENMTGLQRNHSLLTRLK